LKVLLVKGDRICGRSQSIPYGRSSSRIFWREKREPVITKRWWDFRAIAKHSLRAIVFRKSPPASSQGKNLNVLRGDCEALPLGDRSPLGSFHVRFPFGKRLTVNVFRQRMNQLFQGGRHIWRGIAQHARRVIAFRVPHVSSQGKILNVLRGDCEAFPTSHRIQCSPRFLLKGKFWMCWGAIAQHFLREIALYFLSEIAFSVPPGSFSRENSECVEGRLRSTPYGRSRSNL
jgi:hypothetical protein